MKGELALAVVALYAAPAMAVTDASAAVESAVPIFSDDSTFSGVLPEFFGGDPVAAGGEPATILPADEFPATGIVDAIQSWTTEPEEPVVPLSGMVDVAPAAEQEGSAGALVLDLKSFSAGAELLDLEGDLLFDTGSIDGGLLFAVLKLAEDEPGSASRASWSGCGAVSGASSGGSMLILSGDASGCSERRADFSGILDLSGGLADSSRPLGAWIPSLGHSNSPGLGFFLSAQTQMRSYGGNGWYTQRSGYLALPRAVAPRAGTAPLPAVQSPGPPPLLAGPPLPLPAVVPEVAPVPEPAAWALMIAGFAMVGAAVRRRRTLAVAA